jgi:hypothetical protein
MNSWGPNSIPDPKQTDGYHLAYFTLSQIKGGLGVVGVTSGLFIRKVFLAPDCGRLFVISRIPRSKNG